MENFQITVFPTKLGYAIKTRESNVDFLINIVNPQEQNLIDGVSLLERYIKKQKIKIEHLEKIYMVSFQKFPKSERTVKEKVLLNFEIEKLHKLCNLKGELLGYINIFFKKEEYGTTLLFKKGNKYISSDLRIITNEQYEELLSEGYEFLPYDKLQEEELNLTLNEAEISIYEY